MAIKLLSAATATGAGSVYRFKKGIKDHTLEILMGGTAVATAVTVTLEGTLDPGATSPSYYTLASHALTATEITAEKAMFHVTNKLVGGVRANLVTLTGGTAPTITCNYIGEENK